MLRRGLTRHDDRGGGAQRAKAGGRSATAAIVSLSTRARATPRGRSLGFPPAWTRSTSGRLIEVAELIVESGTQRAIRRCTIGMRTYSEGRRRRDQRRATTAIPQRAGRPGEIGQSQARRLKPLSIGEANGSWLPNLAMAYAAHLLAALPFGHQPAVDLIAHLRGHAAVHSPIVSAAGAAHAEDLSLQLLRAANAGPPEPPAHSRTCCA